MSPVLGTSGAPLALAAWTRTDGLRAGVRDERTGRFCAQTVGARPVATRLGTTGVPAAIAGGARGNAMILFVGKSGIEAVFGRGEPRRPLLRRLRVTGLARPRRDARRSLQRSLVLRFSLSEAARVRVTLARKRGKRYRRVGSLALAARAGQNQLAIPARIKKRRLRRGRYRAVVSATDCDRQRSRARRTKTFTR